MRHLTRQSIPLSLLFAWASVQAGCRTLQPCSLRLGHDAARLQVTTQPSAEAEFKRAGALEKAGDDACVDAYFGACALAWQACTEECTQTAWRAYNASLSQLLKTASRYGRLDPARGLTIQHDGQLSTIPTSHQGFPWQAVDFQRLHPPPGPQGNSLQRCYTWPGIGVPLVVERQRNESDAFEGRFFPEKSFFGATAVLRFADRGHEPLNQPIETAAVLEFHNPLAIRRIESPGAPLPLAADLSASLALTLEQAPRSYFAGFIEPGRANTMARLHFLEPYQRGKAPVVLIHGLYSDPISWADMINDLQAYPGFADHFQIWLFRYPSGQGFLQSAASLRTELRTAVSALDPEGMDPALHQMTLIGHSMGGLLAKLQVTYSDEWVWSQLANRPLREIATTDATRALLAKTCYFEPLPNVARVVFIASPHAGSLRSSGFIGKGAALLVEPSPEQAAMHQQLIQDNPNTFNPVFVRRFPTSIDMLAPSSPLLGAMRQMRLAPCVHLHNIVGVSHPISLDGPSDGVVSVHSASHPDCQSVLANNSPHTKIHRTLRTSNEVLRILSCPISTATEESRFVNP